MNSRIVTATLILAGLLLAACGQQAAPAPARVAAQTNPPVPSAAPASVGQMVPETSPLAGTAWQVLTYNNGKQAVGSVLNGTELTAMFGVDGRLAGFAGCNHYGATYETGAKRTIKIGPIAGTQKACAQPEGVMEQETQYLAALQSAAIYEINGVELEIRTATGALAASFQQTAARPAASSASLEPSQIRLDTQGLPYSWQPVLVPATGYDASQPPGPTGLPDHIQILFGSAAVADRQPGTPVMYIIPVDAYKQIWDEAGNPAVAAAINSIFAYTVSLPDPTPTHGMPALPPEEVGGGDNDLAAHVGHIPVDAASATRNGYRFVGRWAQDPNPVTNQNLRYIYQGFTNDGRYLVSFFYPVSSAALPADPSQVPPAELAQLNANPGAYMASQAAKLDSLPPEQWGPELSRLDALVGSLEIEGVPQDGLTGQTWEWAATAASNAAPEPVDKPELYQVTYKSNGTVSAKADCNSASGTYTIGAGSGMLGPITTEWGPMTMAECGPQSRYMEFVNALKAVQSYQVQPGGTRMELLMPANGPRLLFDLPGPGTH